MKIILCRAAPCRKLTAKNRLSNQLTIRSVSLDLPATVCTHFRPKLIKQKAALLAIRRAFPTSMYFIEGHFHFLMYNEPLQARLFEES